jgi:hypothetical protein
MGKTGRVVTKIILLLMRVIGKRLEPLTDGRPKKSEERDCFNHEKSGEVGGRRGQSISIVGETGEWKLRVQDDCELGWEKASSEKLLTSALDEVSDPVSAPPMFSFQHSNFLLARCFGIMTSTCAMPSIRSNCRLSLSARSSGGSTVGIPGRAKMCSLASVPTGPT